MPALTPGLKGSEDIERIDPQLDVVTIGQRGKETRRAFPYSVVLFKVLFRASTELVISYANRRI